jgi:hypothetical protein
VITGTEFNIFCSEHRKLLLKLLRIREYKLKEFSWQLFINSDVDVE